MFIQPKKQKKPLLQLSHKTLLTIGFLLTAIGTVGMAVVQGGLLNMGGVVTTAQLSELASPGSPSFGLVSISVACFALGTFALPVYAMLLVEGFHRTASFRRYFVRMLGFALVAEIPFDLAYSGKPFDMAQQNPLLGYCICLLMLYLLNKLENAYAESKAGSLQLWCIKAAIVVGAIFWVVLSQSLLGIYFVALCAVYWFFGQAGSYDGIYCLIAAVIASILRFPAPFGLFLVHWYDHEQGSGQTGKGGKYGKYLYYVLYPLLLLACAAARFALS